MGRKMFVIDPGHGGKDPGGGTNHLWKEKDLALKISLYQAERFKELGVPYSLTRDKDEYISPAERSKAIRESGADICLSNHINAGGGDGFEAIHSIHSDGRLANLIADAVKATGQNVRRVFCKASNRYPGKDYYFLHRDTGRVQTIINEYGFADSTRDDVEQLRKNWKLYAEAVVKGACQYAGYLYKAPTPKEPKKEETKTATNTDRKLTPYEIELKEAVAAAKRSKVSSGERLNEPATRAQVLVMLYRAGIIK